MVYDGLGMFRCVYIYIYTYVFIYVAMVYILGNTVPIVSTHMAKVLGYSRKSATDEAPHGYLALYCEPHPWIVCYQTLLKL